MFAYWNGRSQQKFYGSKLCPAGPKADDNAENDPAKSSCGPGYERKIAESEASGEQACEITNRHVENKKLI